ncbi:MAG: SURF1 family protein [Chloroflexota bacterium]
MILRAALSRKWLLTTLLVLAGGAVCVRLGIWQLDRLDQRRAFNAHVEAMRSESPLDLNAGIPAELTEMEYRAVVVSGTYDYGNQVALRNQFYGDAYGYHLLTPLVLDDTSTSASTGSAQQLSAGGRAVLVDRGWVPAEGNDSPSGWSRYDNGGQAQVRGVIRLGQAKAQIGGVPDPTLAPGQTRLDFWYVANLERIAGQIPYPILPVYIQPDPDPADTEPPIPFQPEIELTEGPHLGYALQWFTFAAILVAGYPFYLRKQIAGKP